MRAEKQKRAQRSKRVERSKQGDDLAFEMKAEGPKGSPDAPCIILVSMIKNEAKVICRMLDSAAAVATHFCLTDTGSTDDTLKVIKDWGKKHAVPLVVYSRPFVDFGSTRTDALQAAARWARQNGLDADNSYLLLLDADMVLEATGFDAAQLKADNYRIVQANGSLNYFNTRLVRVSKVRRYVGRTHEYIETTGTVRSLDTLRIRDVGDGGCKADKFERDVRLLTQDLSDNPNNARSMYYLATSYEALGRRAEAIEMYTKRANAPSSWDEEAWMASYRRGIVREAAGDKEGAAKDYVDAWAARPWRAEPLAKLANMALAQKDYRKACTLSKAGIHIPYPKDDVLFIEAGCYNDEFHQVLAISDFYTGGHYDGAKHCDHLILSGSHYRVNALQNAAWYMKPLKALRVINLGDAFKDAIPEGYKPCNPSIVRHFDREKNAFRYSLSLRTVNYSIRPDGSYDYPGYVHTRTLRCELDADLSAVAAIELENAKGEPSRIRGIEDVRLYQDRLVDDRTYGLGVRVDGLEPRPQIYACAWEGKKLVACNLLSAPESTEKNWLPVMNAYAEGPQTNTGPYFLYATGPDMIIKRNAPAYNYKARTPMDVHDFRGGSNVIPYLGGWLWVIHQVTVLPGETKRKYLHRLCWSRGNKDGPTVDGFKTSLPFCFEKPQIEFCSGACVGPDGSLLLAYGVEDNYAFLAMVDEKVVADMLGI